VIAGFPSDTVIVKVAVPLPPALLAPIVTPEEPMAVGLPEMSPEAVFTVKPDGSPVALNPVGELLAVIW
jgi:hypothetical protein